jgi:hypothetical protein
VGPYVAVNVLGFESKHLNLAEGENMLMGEGKTSQLGVKKNPYANLVFGSTLAVLSARGLTSGGRSTPSIRFATATATSR